jgi:hypothetical protein
MNKPSQNIIIYNTVDGKTSVSLLAKEALTSQAVTGKKESKYE